MPSIADWIENNQQNRGQATKNIVTKNQPAVQRPYRAMGRSFEIIDGAELWGAQKSIGFSRYMMDFVNDTGLSPNPYTQRQLLSAYMSSVYLFAAIRRIADLISRVKIVAEIKQGQRFVRAPETEFINTIFEQEAAQILPNMYLNYAVYGAAVVYKVKSRKAYIETNAGRPIYDYKDDAVAGLYVLDRPQWELDQDIYRGYVKGLHVNQSNPFIGDKRYIDRKEFVYYTAWNPENPNEGRSIVTHAIHEAIANSSIARWMSEYFTRGAMPFVMVSIDDEMPNMMTEADLRKYKREFEDHWQGLNSSLRSVFLDKKVTVEQVGIPASEVAAPELNNTALEGISAAVGINRELIVTPEGYGGENHAIMVKQVWQNTIIPLLEKFLVAFNKDLGFSEDMRLTYDLSHISELDAERAEQSSTEVSLFEVGLQSYNETRSRLNQSPIKELEGFININGHLIDISKLKMDRELFSDRFFEQMTSAWESDLIKKGDIMQMLGRSLDDSEVDGYKSEIDGYKDFVMGLWGDELITRSEALEMLGYSMPAGAMDGFKTEIENELQSHVDLRERKYEEEDNFIDMVQSLWGDNLLLRSEALSFLGFRLPDEAPDGYKNEIEGRIDMEIEIETGWRQMELDIEQMRQEQELEKQMSLFEKELEQKEFVQGLYEANLIKRSETLKLLGFNLPLGEFDGYAAEVELIVEKMDEAGIYKNRIPGMNAKPPAMPSTPPIPELPPPAPPEGETPAPEEGETEVADESTSAPSAEVEAPAPLEEPTVPSEEGGEPTGETPPASEVATEGEAAPPELTAPPESGTEAPPPAPVVTEEPPAAVESPETPAPEPAPAPAEEATASIESKIPSYLSKRVKMENDEIVTIFKSVLNNPIKISVKSSFGVPGAAVILSFEGNRDIYAIQQDIMKRLPENTNARWTSPDNFHVTLASIPLIGDEHLENLSSSFDNRFSNIELKSQKITMFEKDGYNVIILKIDKDNALKNLQSEVYNAIVEQGVTVSGYSIPDSFEPHITLGYVPKSTTVDDSEIMISIQSDKMVFSRDAYVSMFEVGKNQNNNGEHNEREMLEDIFERRNHLVDIVKKWFDIGTADENVPENIMLAVNEVQDMFTEQEFPKDDILECCLEAVSEGLFDEQAVNFENPIITVMNRRYSYQDNANEELRAWEKAAVNGGIGKALRFESVYLNPEQIDEIKSSLKSLDSHDGASIRMVFSNAKQKSAKNRIVNADLMKKWAERLAGMSDEELRKLVLVRNIPYEKEGGENNG